MREIKKSTAPCADRRIIGAVLGAEARQIADSAFGILGSSRADQRQERLYEFSRSKKNNSGANRDRG